MSAIHPLVHLLSIKSNKQSKLTKNATLTLEAELLHRICLHLENYFREQHQTFYRLIGLSKNKGQFMLEQNFVRLIINDILATEEYTISGIAYYMNTHEDVIYDIAIGRNNDPSSSILRKSIELHRTVRHELYSMMISRILDDLSQKNE